MRSRSDIHVRQLEVGDFPFVQELAAKQPNFTVPPAYVLWLLLRIKDAVCLVAEDSRKGPLAYLLSIPIETPVRAAYVWQLAATDLGQRMRAVPELLLAAKEIAHKLKIRTIFFSAVPGSPHQRLIRMYSEKLFLTTPLHVSNVPSFVSDNESEYRLELPLTQQHKTRSPD